MFGYIKPCKPQLRVCEYETYRAVYCGLCKQLGRQYGPFSRLTLSFDFTFLALLKMALTPDAVEFHPARCMLNPFKKHPCCAESEPLSFSAGTAMILGYYKVLDNYQDGDFKKRTISVLCMPFAKHAYKGAVDQYPQVAQIAYETISQQSAVEQALCDSIDLACEPTAQALSGICSLLDDRQQRVLGRFGYLLGRYIYMADALDDLEEDLKQHSYNPFLLREGITANDASSEQLSQVRERAKGSLYLTMSELAKAYSLLELHSFSPILDNIIHLGLHDAVERILLPKETKTDDGSL